MTQKPGPCVRVLFVCMGNICRSPAAHGIMEELVRRRGLHDVIQIDSAGTISYHEGNPPDRRMAEAAKARGYNLNHRARQVRRQDFESCDYVIAMDAENLANLKRMAGPHIQKLSLMMDHCEPRAGCEVPDPYYGGSAGFEHVLDMLERACAALLEKIVTEHKLDDSAKCR